MQVNGNRWHRRRWRSIGMLVLGAGLLSSCSSGASGSPTTSTATVGTKPATAKTMPTTATTTTTTTTPPPPVLLGSAFATYVSGFGTEKPATVHYGGDGYSEVNGITWQGWGAAQVTGTGQGWYVPSGDSNGQGSTQPATVVAFALGTCGSGPAYTKFSYYFPGQGESFNSSFFMNACTGDWTFPDATPTTTAPPAAASAAPCTGDALAQAAQTWVTQQPDGMAGTSAITAFACDGTYAGAVVSTTTGAGYGYNITFRSGGGGWSVIASSNILPPDGLPSDVYAQLQGELQSASQSLNFPF
jgi:hypothetical protein